MFSVLFFLTWSAFELGHAEDTGAMEVPSVVLYKDAYTVTPKAMEQAKKKNSLRCPSYLPRWSYASHLEICESIHVIIL